MHMATNPMLLFETIQNLIYGLSLIQMEYKSSNLSLLHFSGQCHLDGSIFWL
jgi:hypothetical protein